MIDDITAHEGFVSTCYTARSREDDPTISVVTHAVPEDCQLLCRDRSCCGYKEDEQDLTIFLKHHWCSYPRGLQRQANQELC